jgi:uncharacterized lipoprotein YbaY
MKRIIVIAGSLFTGLALLSGCSEAEKTTPVDVVSQEMEVVAEATDVEVVTVAEDSQIISGTIYAKQVIAPATGEGYNVKVVLADVSKIDVAATVISSTVFTTKHLPVKYSIAIDPTMIEPRISYDLQTHITDEEGNLVGVTDQHHKYTLNDPSIEFDILVKAIQLEAPIPTQMKMTCGEDNYSLAIYPRLLVKTDLAIHNQHILPHVVSASGAHYQSDSESIFMKGEMPPLVEINSERVDCTLN